ncbi:glutamate receptor ionotropic, kainate 1 [Teleopsis dalmanni]|uniref:glutamate receptor ionotropic, kainate 1 n=1 Tax=Teleopsis dalmanni TaxID=139649 RepID=UPI0018CDEE27|nr:glutamate receptor ionotropic, kainate 1 [Teleopsis dalmanni]
MRLLLGIALCVTFQLVFNASAISAEFEVVKIGAIFFHNEIDLIEAFETAIEDINQLELNVRLQPIKHYLSADDSIVLQKLTCHLIESNVAAIFGPSSKASSDIVEVLCNITGIPHLQYDWHIQETGLYYRNHQMTVNVAPSEFGLSTAYWDILRSNRDKWKSFTIVYESSSNLARMQELFSWKQLHKTGIKVHKFKRGDDYRILWKVISNSRERFVVLDCPSDIVYEVVNASIYFNMTGSFNHLFLTNLDTHLGDLGRFYAKEFTVAAMAVRLRPYIPPPVHEETDIFEPETTDKIVHIHAQLIYDAVVLYFHALTNVINALKYYEPNLHCGQGFWKPGPLIIREMKNLTPKNVTPHYKTQKLLINSYGRRDDFNLEIYNPVIEQITHVWNKQHHLVSFDEVSTNSKNEAKKRKFNDKEDFSQKKPTYTVATRVGEPYFMWKPEREGEHFEGNERFRGYVVDLLYKLADECKFEFVLEPVSDNNYGSPDPETNEWNGIIKQIIDNKAQIGVCDLTITQARRSVVDFTNPFMQLGVSILYYKDEPPAANLFGFLKPFALEVWAYLLMALIITALVMIIQARISQLDWEKQVQTDPNIIVLENKWHLINNLWLVIGSIMTAGCDILPRGGATRLLTAFWWIFALLLSQTYIAKLASFITSSKMEGSIRDLHDLVGQNKIQFGTIKGGSTSMFFSESNESDYRVAWNKMIAMKPDAFTSSNKEGVDRVRRSRGRYAFLMETTNLQYYVQRNCDLQQIGEPFGVKHYGLAVPLNAPFRSNLSVGILKLSEKGVLYNLKKTWLNDNKTMCKQHTGSSSNQETQYTMESLGGLFIVLAGGILIGIVLGIGEFLWYIESIAAKENISPMVALKSEFKFFLRFWIRYKPIKIYLANRSSTSTGYSSFKATSTSTFKKKKKSKKKIVLNSD